MISKGIESTLLYLIQQGTLSEREMASRARVARGTVRSRKAGYRGHPGVVPKQIDDRCPVCSAKLTEFPCRACQILHQIGDE